MTNSYGKVRIVIACHKELDGPHDGESKSNEREARERERGIDPAELAARRAFNRITARARAHPSKLRVPS